MALDALEGHLEALADDNDPIPAPSRHEDVWGMVHQDFEKDGEAIPQGTVLQLVPVPNVQEKPSRVTGNIISFSFTARSLPVLRLIVEILYKISNLGRPMGLCMYFQVDTRIHLCQDSLGYTWRYTDKIFAYHKKGKT